jgi:uncharacterized membrane protein
MSASRKALIVANDEYEHDGLGQLLAPSADAQALAAVLGDEQVGDFDVQVVRNEPAHVIQAQVEELFSEARPDDVLLLHFSCHGLKNESGELFFATINTRPNRLGSTAVSADFVQRCLRTSRSRSVVLLLDCCYGGAFAQGVTVRAAGDVDVLSSFPSERARSGRGRAVISASSAMEYAFEGDRLADDAAPRPSVFTTALVEGLETGDADRDQDGWVSLDELYDYVFDKVRERNPHQTPSRDVEMQGDLFIARRRHPVTTPAALQPELLAAIDSPLAGIRAGAVQELARVLRGGHAGRALAARLALDNLAQDDSRQVSAAAAAVLHSAPSPGPAAAGDPEIAAPAASPAAVRTAGDSAAPAEAGPPAAVPEEPAAVLAEPPAVPAERPVAAGESAGPEWRVSADRRLFAAGLLSIAEAIVLIVVLYVPIDRDEPTFRLITSLANSQQLAIDAAAAVAAGICLLIPRASGLIGTGLILGTVTTVPADLAITAAARSIHPYTALGAVLLLGIEVPGAVAAVLAGLALRRARVVRVQLRSLLGRGPAQAASWVVIALGVAGAVAYALQVGRARDVPGFGADLTITDQLVIPLVWLTGMAVAIPVIAAAARPRPFGTALLGGWICVALGEASFSGPFKTSAFGYTLVALAVALIPFARTARAARSPAGPPADPRLTAAGLMSVLAAILLIIAPNELFGTTYNLFDHPANTQQILISAAGALAAGVCLLIPVSRRGAGAGLALGAAAAVPGNVALIIVVIQGGSSIRAGDWLVIGGEALIVTAGVLASLALRRGGAARPAPGSRPAPGAHPAQDARPPPRSGPAPWLRGRPGRPPVWLVAFLGAAGAVAFAVQAMAETTVPGQGTTSAGRQLIIPVAWTVLVALVIPAAGVLTRSRPFGTALIGGWIIGSFAEIAFITRFQVSVFGYTLAALAIALIPFARTAPPERDEPVAPAR